MKRWKILPTTSWFPSHSGPPVTGIPNGGIHVFRDMDIHTCHTNCHTKLRQYFLICLQFFNIFLWLIALSQNVTKDPIVINKTTKSGIIMIALSQNVIKDPSDIDKTTKNEIATIFNESFNYRYGKIEYIQKRIHIAILRDNEGTLLEISYSMEIRSVTKGTFKLTDLECTCKSQRILLRRMWVLSISTSRTCQTFGQHLSRLIRN